MEKKSVEKSGNIVINTNAVKISNNSIKNKKVIKNSSFKTKPLNNRELQFALIENFVNMQKVLTNLTVKFESLSENMSKLLQLFEISAKSFMQKQTGVNISEEKDLIKKNETEEKDLIKKLDILLDQNKTVAKGITLIEEKIRHKIYGEHLTKNENSQNNSGPSINLNEKPRPGLVPRV